MRDTLVSAYNNKKKGFSVLFACNILDSLYIGQGSYKIVCKEMIHNVKEAQKKALKTVERYASKKNNCLNHF